MESNPFGGIEFLSRYHTSRCGTLKPLVSVVAYLPVAGALGGGEGGGDPELPCHGVEEGVGVVVRGEAGGDLVWGHRGRFLGCKDEKNYLFFSEPLF